VKQLLHRATKAVRQELDAQGHSLD
jgi:hypothetical protein